MNVATSAAASPTKIDVSDPLIVFAITSRPHLSAPNGSVARRSAAVVAATGPPAGARLPASMSFMTSASGSTDLPSVGRGRGRRRLLRALDFLHDVGQRIDEAAGGRRRGPSAFAPPFNSAMTSPIGSTTVELNALPGVGPDGAAGSSTLFVTSGAGASGPTNVGGA